MPRLVVVSHRFVLLASTVGLVTAGFGFAGTSQAATQYTNSTPVSGVSALYVLGTQDSLTNTSSITINSGSNPAVSVGGAPTAFITNSGTILSNGATGGQAVTVGAGGTLTSLTNSAGGLIAADGTSGTALLVSGAIGTLTNAGIIRAQGANGTAVNVVSPGSVGTISNSGTIQADGTGGTAISVASGSVIAAITNSGTIQAAGTSGVALAVYGTVNALTNQAGGLIAANGSGGTAILVDGGQITTLTNAGTIQAQGSGGTAIGLTSASIGTIANSGIIQADGAYGAAISVDPASTIGAITSSGTIQAAGTGGVAIGDYGTITAISNLAGGLIAADSSSGAAVVLNGRTLGSLTNAGIIRAQGTSGIALSIVAGSVGSITNSGTLQADGTSGQAIGVGSAGTIGTITNSGTIQAAGVGGVAIEAGGTIATINNLAGGLIAADNNTSSVGSSAIKLTSGAAGSVTGGTISSLVNAGIIRAQGANGIALNVSGGGAVGTISNSGTIQANGSAGTAIYVDSASTTGALTNRGVVQAAGANGTAIANLGSITSLTNSGSIVAAQGTAIYTGSTGAFASGITNTAAGLVQGGAAGGIAIDNSANSNPLTITNAGTIVGQVKFGSGGDTLTITGGSITGSIVDQSGNGGTVNFSTQGAYTTGGGLTGVDTVNVTSGAVTFQYPIASALLLSIQNGASVALHAAVQADQVTNSGALTVGATSQTITGNYTQNSTGQLGITITDSASGQLKVTGTATVAGSVVATVTTSTRSLVGQSLSVLNAGTLVPGTVTVSGNSPFVDLTASETGTDLLLVGTAPSFAQASASAHTLVTSSLGAASGLSGVALQNAQSAGVALQGVLTNQFLHAGSQTLYNVLTGLSQNPAGLSQFFRQLAPSQFGRVQAELLTTLVSGGGGSAIANRLNFARANGGTPTGLAAGDEDDSLGITAWVQPFGSQLSQGSKQGVDGYDSWTYGASFGGDTLVYPDVRLGLAVDLGNTDVTYKNSLSGNKSSVFTAQGSGYGNWSLGNAFVDGQISFGYNGFSGTNYVSATGTKLKSSFGGLQVLGRLGAGYIWKTGGFTITPLVGLQQIHDDIDSYTTSGGGSLGLDEHVNSQSIDITQTRIGSSFAYPLAQATGQVFTPELHVYYLHNFGPDHLTTTATFSGGGGAFGTVSPTLGHDIVNVGAGLTFIEKGPLSVAGVYDYTGSNGINQNSFYLRLKTEF